MADITASVASWSTTEASNSPSGGATVGTGLDDNLRAIQAGVRKEHAQSSDLSAASTIDLSTATGSYVEVTTSGTVSVSSLGTVAAGIERRVAIKSVGTSLTFTHNATSLILPDGQDIKAKAGDVALFVSLGGGNWRCINYQSLRPSFSANKNGTDQTLVTAGTKITFGTEDWDIGSYFASSTWTPPAGKYRITAAILISSGITDQSNYGFAVYKNGAAHKSLGSIASSGAGGVVLNGSAIVDANGTDTFEIYLNTSSTTVTIGGAASATYFCGEQL